MSNIRLINETTTTVTNLISITDVFSADFDIYKIVISGLNQDTNVANEINGIRFINSSGSLISASDYDYAVLEMKSAGSYSDSSRSTSASNIFMGQRADQVGDGSNNTVFYVFNPFSSTSYTFTLSQSVSFDGAENNINGKGIGLLHQTNSITGFQIYDSDSGRPFESGSKIITYGLAVN